MHSESTTTCSHCGASLTPRTDRTVKFCSRSCFQAYQSGAWLKRFWARVQKSDDCWLWTGYIERADGYGRYYLEGSRRKVGAHRIAYELTYGPVPANLYICHHCDNPPCVRPDHLFVGSQADNVADCIDKDRFVSGERNGMAKLTEADVRAIRERYQQGGVTHQQLANELGVTKTLVGLIVRGKVWKNLLPE